MRPRGTADDRESRDQLIRQRLLEGLPVKVIRQRFGVSWVVVDNARQQLRTEIKGYNMNEALERLEKQIKLARAGMQTHDFQDWQVETLEVLEQAKKLAGGGNGKSNNK